MSPQFFYFIFLFLQSNQLAWAETDACFEVEKEILYHVKYNWHG
jgi:hypothetical protein